MYTLYIAQHDEQLVLWESTPMHFIQFSYSTEQMPCQVTIAVGANCPAVTHAHPHSTQGSPTPCVLRPVPVYSCNVVLDGLLPIDQPAIGDYILYNWHILVICRWVDDGQDVSKLSVVLCMTSHCAIWLSGSRCWYQCMCQPACTRGPPQVCSCGCHPLLSQPVRHPVVRLQQLCTASPQQLAQVPFMCTLLSWPHHFGRL